MELLAALFQGRCQRRPAAHEEGCTRCDSLRLEGLVEIDLDLGNAAAVVGTDEACIAGAALVILVLLLLAERSDALPCQRRSSHGLFQFLLNFVVGKAAGR